MVLIRDHDIHGLLFFRVNWCLYYRKEVLMIVLMILLGILRWVTAYLIIGLIYVWITKVDVRVLKWAEKLRLDDGYSLIDDEDYKDLMKNNRKFRTQITLTAIIVCIVYFPAICICDKIGMFK